MSFLGLFDVKIKSIYNRKRITDFKFNTIADVDQMSAQHTVDLCIVPLAKLTNPDEGDMKKMMKAHSILVLTPTKNTQAVFEPKKPVSDWFPEYRVSSAIDENWQNPKLDSRTGFWA